MLIIACIIMTFVLLIVHSLLCNLFIELFMITGLSKERSKFQTYSLFSSCGFTSSESELIMCDRTRRRIALACIISGWIFTALITAVILGVVTGLDFKGENSDEYLARLFITLGVCIGVFVIYMFLKRIVKVRRGFDRLIRKIFKKLTKVNSAGNSIIFKDMYLDKVVAEIHINKLPTLLKGKRLVDINFKRNFNLDIMTFTDKNGVIYTEITDDLILDVHTKMTVYGKAVDINKIFNTK